MLINMILSRCINDCVGLHCVPVTTTFEHVLQATAVDALVAVLQHTGASHRDLCSVLCTGSALRLAVMSSCSSCIQLSIQLQGLQQAVRFASWLAQNGHLLDSLEVRVRAWEAHRNSLGTADLQDALKLGLQGCHSKGNLWQLKRFSTSSLPCSHRMLASLPTRTLVSLQLDLSSMPYHRLVRSYPLFCTALGQLRNLRDVSIKLPFRWPPLEPTESLPVEGLLPGIAQLTNLTKLAFSGIERETLCHAHHLPASLVQLQLNSMQRDERPKDEWTCYLSHLTAVTSLGLKIWLPPSTSLPPFTQQLVMTNFMGAQNLAILTSSSPPIKTLHLTVKPSVGPQLSTLAALSTLTELELDTFIDDGFDSMALAWPSLSMLRALVLRDYYDRVDGLPLNQIVTPTVLSYLAASTSLTRLVIECCGEITRSEREVMGWCQHIAQLHQLRHLDFGGEYALGGSARHLARLTQLTYLCISNSQVPDRVAVAFGCALKCLVELDLSGNQDLSDACAAALAQLTGLTALRLTDLPGFTEEGLQELSTLRKLQRLEVDEEDLAEGAVEGLWAAIRG